MKNGITKKALQNYLTKGGATLTVAGVPASFRGGYQVAGIAPVAVVPVADINAVFESVKNCLNGCTDGEFCGLWVSCGFVYVEKSEHVARLSEAMKKGVERGEKSIWDFCLNREIVTNE